MKFFHLKSLGSCKAVDGLLGNPEPRTIIQMSAALCDVCEHSDLLEKYLKH